MLRQQAPKPIFYIGSDCCTSVHLSSSGRFLATSVDAGVKVLEIKFRRKQEPKGAVEDVAAEKEANVAGYFLEPVVDFVTGRLK